MIYDSGIRPAIDDYLLAKSKEERDYGDYWSASSAGYCHRKLVFDRLGVPSITKDDDGRKQRVFTAGHIFHEWVQRITKSTGLSLAQELELQDDKLMVRGHVDDIISKDGKLILYDYKTQHSNAFSWQKGRPASHYHEMQVGTYLYLLRQLAPYKKIEEARILKISKDDLRMDENQLFYTPVLEEIIVTYWDELNDWWNRYQLDGQLPPCTCHVYENGFMAKEKFNPYFYKGEPCSLAWHEKWKKDAVTV